MLKAEDYLSYVNDLEINKLIRKTNGRKNKRKLDKIRVKDLPLEEQQRLKRIKIKRRFMKTIHKYSPIIPQLPHDIINMIFDYISEPKHMCMCSGCNQRGICITRLEVGQVYQLNFINVPQQRLCGMCPEHLAKCFDSLPDVAEGVAPSQSFALGHLPPYQLLLDNGSPVFYFYQNGTSGDQWSQCGFEIKKTYMKHMR